MFRELGDLDDASGILKYVIMRNAYNISTYTLGTGDVTTTLDMDAEKVKWYLSAVDQFVNLK